mgnify:FL=1
MANYTVCKLHFTSPVHFGDNRSDYGVSLKTVQSDTIYAAVTSCLSKIGVQIPDNGGLGCSVSSAFPFYQENRNSSPVYFFPKPLRYSLPNLKDISDAKKVKKVRWLDFDYFRRVINGEQLFVDGQDITSIKHGGFLTAGAIAEDFISSQVSPRVTMPSRLGDEDARPFYMDRVFFKGYSGLFFLAEGDCSLLDRGLKLLQYEGIGTDRNVGNGYFECQKDSITIECPESSEYSISLSIFIPENKEKLALMLGKEAVAYDFARRGGWITESPYNSIRKNAVYAFLPASVFALGKSPCVEGRIVNLQPESLGEIIRTENLGESPHPIWRCGKSIFIPIKI